MFRRPRDLGTRPGDRTRLCESQVLAHLARAMPQGGRITAGDLVGGGHPGFEQAPDPFLRFGVERARHLALPKTPGLRRLSVLTYNAALLDRSYLLTRVRMPEVERRRGRIWDELLGDGWDALLLQEVWDDADLERLESAAADRGYRVWGGTKGRHHHQHGLAIAVHEGALGPGAVDRTEAQFTTQYRLEQWPGPDVKRGWLSWRFQHADTGRSLRLWTTHMTPFPPYWRHRRAQARELGLAVREAAAADGPHALQVVGGDMNAAPHYAMAVWRQPGGHPVRDLWQNAASYALLRHYGELEDAAVLGGLGVTAERAGFTAVDSTNSLCERSYAGLEPPARLDHLLLGDPARCARITSAELAYTERYDWGPAGRFELSDHYGVAATLSIEKCPPESVA